MNIYFFTLIKSTITFSLSSQIRNNFTFAFDSLIDKNRENTKREKQIIYRLINSKA